MLALGYVVVGHVRVKVVQDSNEQRCVHRAARPSNIGDDWYRENMNVRMNAVGRTSKRCIQADQFRAHRPIST